eukprot:JZ554617.1.p2 GENE.JZ554617.1~~JZ554617.1.p2  ORF type:complete len:121 (+),score=24.30 JZ554617.1:282-644(+)
MLKMVEANESSLSPSSADALCYHPMSRGDLEAWLGERDIVIKAPVLDLVYARLEGVMHNGESLSGLEEASRAYTAPVASLFQAHGMLAGSALGPGGTGTQEDGGDNSMMMRAAAGIGATM